jgi:hypothetical protein
MADNTPPNNIVDQFGQPIKQLNEQKDTLRDINKEVNDLFSGYKAISDEVKKGNEGYITAKKSLTSLTSLSGKLLDITSGITKTNSKDLSSIIEKIKQERKQLEIARDLLLEKQKAQKLSEAEQITLTNLIGITKEEEGIYDDTLKSAEKILDTEIKTEKSMRAVGAAAEGISKGLQKAGLGAIDTYLGIGKAVDKTKDLVRAKDGVVGGLETAGILAKELGTNLMEALGPEVLMALAIQQMVEAFKMIDKTSGDMAKNLGISYDEAQQLSQDMNSVAMSSNDVMVNMRGMMEAQSKLNAMLGTSTQYSGKLAEDYASVSARLKLSDGAMDSFSKLTLMNGEGLKDNLNSVNYTVLKLNQQNKLGLSYKTIQESIGKASAATRLSLGENSTKLAEAAFQAKKLGVEIEKINQIGSSLLDFESSISSEMEAELLTGKDLNLERARLAALNNDTATLAKEISEQMGSAADFTKMNVLQQDALAKSMGMNRNDMAEMLETTEMLAGSGMDSLVEAQKEYNKMVAEGASQAELDAKFKNTALKSQLESVNVQERFSAITEKLQGMFITLMEPLIPVLELLFDLVEGVIEPLTSTFGELGKMFKDILPAGIQLGNIFKMIGNVVGILAKVGFVEILWAVNMIKENLKGVFEIFGGLKKMFVDKELLEGLKEIGAGIVRIVLSPIQAIIDVAVSIINDVISMMNKVPGVNIEKIQPKNMTDAIFMAEGGIVTKPTNAIIGEAGPEAVIPLNKNLNVNLDPLIQKIDELISAVKQGGNVYLDSNKVGQAHNIGAVKVQ